jgi:DNA-binding LytR/AlgR family response regulator
MLPLRLTVGILSWIILMQGYRISQMQGDKREEVEDKRIIPPPEPADRLDRISVKDGGRIHIVHLDELLYIQASGDYATLFTPTGQYIKEQTMKYFETHLPPASFVRIHRSTIVNTDQIMRVELFGKESYQVRLKNGVNLRASGAGYKLLKERLSL